MINPDDICRMILAIAACNKNVSNDKVAACAIGSVLRQYGKYLVSSKSQGDILISLAKLNSPEPTEMDHSIPINTLVKEILKLNATFLGDTTPCILALRVMIQDHIHTVKITKNEHKKLGSQPYNLKSSMPRNWCYDDDWQARYKAAGIEVIPQLPDSDIVGY